MVGGVREVTPRRKGGVGHVHRGKKKGHLQLIIGRLEALGERSAKKRNHGKGESSNDNAQRFCL